AEQHLCEVMFKGKPDAEARAARIAADLGDHTKHKMHGRRLSRRYLQALGLEISEIERDQVLQDLALTVHHCVMHTFEFVPFLTKLVLNSLGTVVPTFSPKGLSMLAKQGLDAKKLKDVFFKNSGDSDISDADEADDSDGVDDTDGADGTDGAKAAVPA